MIDIKDLPKILPLLPVQGAILFPKGQLPLPIVSPKHFAAVAEIWHTHRIIGIVQPQALDMDGSTQPLFYTSGSAGKIIEMSEFDDGKLYVIVTGLCRFDIVQDIDPKAEVRRAKVDYSAYTMDLAVEADFSLDRPKLLKELSTYFKRLNIDANWDEIQKIPSEKLVTALAMACPFSVGERQALLQCSTMTEQSKLITSLIEMANKEPNIFNITCH
ncbi:MAG: LON peptidase substrate-binding domain-containing protein [Alphaproteobacteria bacterium]|nr:LON peptidase substrate-binding domain-containing protein [Alphaproteobacteria bacterium]